MLRAELVHVLRELEVHVLFHAHSRCFLVRRLFAHDFCAHRAFGRERLCDGFALEAHNRLGNHRVEHARCAVPRLGALLDLQAQQFQALCIGFLPVLAAVAVVVNVARQVARHGGHGALRHVLGQVGVEVVGRRLGFFDLNLQVAHVDAHGLGVNDLNLDRFFRLGGCCNARGLLEQRLVDIRGHGVTLS